MDPGSYPTEAAERFARPEIRATPAHDVALEQRRAEFESYLARIEPFKPVTAGVSVLEVGSGTGWFLVLCALRGAECEGLELNRVNVEYTRQLAAANGVDVTIRDGSVEDVPLPPERFDIAVAMSVFEHVPDWRAGLRNVHRSLRPGGVLYFYSTNKFSLRSGEYPGVPFYNWLPFALRRRIRTRRNEAILRSRAMDYNQFTYRGLRRAFREVGFTTVLDQFELPEPVASPTPWKRAVVRAYRRFPPLAPLVRLLAPGTAFICVK